MSVLKSALLASAAAFIAAGAAHAADLPVNKAVPSSTSASVAPMAPASFTFLGLTLASVSEAVRGSKVATSPATPAKAAPTVVTPRDTRGACASISMPARKLLMGPCEPSCASMPAPGRATLVSALQGPSSASVKPFRSRHRSVRPRSAVCECRQGIHSVRGAHRWSRLLILRFLRPRFRVRRRHSRIRRVLYKSAGLHGDLRQWFVGDPVHRRPCVPSNPDLLADEQPSWCHGQRQRCEFRTKQFASSGVHRLY